MKHCSFDWLHAATVHQLPGALRACADRNRRCILVPHEYTARAVYTALVFVEGIEEPFRCEVHLDADDRPDVAAYKGQ